MKFGNIPPDGFGVVLTSLQRAKLTQLEALA